MCGRYAFDDSKEIYEARRFIEDIASNIGSEAAANVKTGDVFPTDTAAVLAQTPVGALADVMSWGFPIRGSKRRIINARCETAQDKPMFAASLKDHKCLVPCTGFYEWKKLESHKQKYLISLGDARFFYLAGLYKRFVKGGQPSAHFVILTAPANADMKDIHDRMPLIVPPQGAYLWLSADANYLEQMRKVYATTGALQISTVS